MQHFAHTAEGSSTSTLARRVRTRPAIHLCSGDLVGAFAEFATHFDEGPLFLSQHSKNRDCDPKQWLAERISDVACLAEVTNTSERPIVLPMPASCLTDTQTVDTCVHAVAQTRLCHQELSFEITDSAFATHALSARKLIQSFRQRGFRVSIDIRKSWIAHLSSDCWLMIDTLRLNANDIWNQPALIKRLEIAASAGVAIVAEKPKWRDGDELAALGIEYGLSLRADA